jgi:hypothetical protein
MRQGFEGAATLWHQSLSASRLGWFGACPGAPFHRLHLYARGEGMLAGHLGTGHRAECPSGLFHPWGNFNGRRHACRVDARAGRGRTKSKSAIAPRHFHARFSVAIGARRLITRRLANETSTLLRRLFRCRVRGRLHPAGGCLVAVRRCAAERRPGSSSGRT